ncbi:IclR family transcriptional regulator [Nocardioides sp. LHD-245]|uniref:IclR family transcriptional regulator n=1 Tax=Nocardioides sp. LHD-245 TaxID=3051387 RepID=UPI0027DF1BDE|nr:IclR family transcriptional regulator [Nocardioides sp. LHD-245]
MAALVKSADRVLQILDLLTEHPDGLTLTEIQRAMDFPKSSTFGLVNTMAVRGFVQQDPNTRKYAVGIRLWQAGQSYLTATSLEQLALPYMTAVRDALNETVQLAILDGTDNVYIGKVDPDQQLRLASHVGARLPAYATGLGKALLSLLPDEEVRRRFDGVAFTPYTERSLHSVDELIAVLGEIRARGYAEDDAEYTEGVYCIAFPLKPSRDYGLASISVSVPHVRRSDDLTARTIESLRHATVQISQRLS